MLPGGKSTKTSRFEPIENPRKISLNSTASSSTPLPSSPSKSIQEKQNDDIPLDTSFSSSPSASATIIARNEDLLTQILLKLPPKSLLRFQCVSKQWLSLISDPVFRRRHSSRIRRYPTTDFLFFSSDSYRNEIDLLSFSGDWVDSVGNVSSPLRYSLEGEILSLQSCNGLLCIQFMVNDISRELIVYNPTTCKHRSIPWPYAESIPLVIRYTNIAFDPVKSDYYKLVCVGVDLNGTFYRFLVYSSEAGVWSVSRDALGMDSDSAYYFGKGVLWNGDVHFLGSDCCTLCFDIENECLQPSTPRIPTNLEVVGRWDIRYFGETGGNLYVICLNKPKAMLFDVFALKRDYSQWVVKYRVDFAPLITCYPEMKNRGFHTPCFVVDKEGKKARIVILVEDKFIYYDIHGMFVKELVEVVPVYAEVGGWGDSTWYRWCEAYQHVDTLASV
ncbi:F-box protein At5g07610-like [Coffea eugenioides]|uniref:F-box protein At5g07610-like n=1 Tax=Coffea eugenioides TaxID=49369 RepID=UPI000F60D920|nr:F-box protein At5g07610-like [Coffea eugenioides]XP_027155274.1 F-box protein At5g07610-like [Coffea eugenioides]